MSKKKKSTGVIAQIKSFVSIIFVVLLIRSSFFEPFKIPSGSMVPTLHVGDFVFVNKMSYGFKLPFSEWILDKPIVLAGETQPSRGDIIVFKYPRDPSIYFIKRVIGLPGETIQIKNKVVYIDGKPLTQTASPDGKTSISILHEEDYPLDSLEVLQEDSGRKHLIVKSGAHDQLGNYPSTKIPEGQFFVMGDNRDFSSDSRVWGFVSQDAIKGRAVVIWLSLWMDFARGRFEFHPSHIGRTI